MQRPQVHDGAHLSLSEAHRHSKWPRGDGVQGKRSAPPLCLLFSRAWGVLLRSPQDATRRHGTLSPAAGPWGRCPLAPGLEEPLQPAPPVLLAPRGPVTYVKPSEAAPTEVSLSSCSRGPGQPGVREDWPSEDTPAHFSLPPKNTH